MKNLFLILFVTISTSSSIHVAKPQESIDACIDRVMNDSTVYEMDYWEAKTYCEGY